jgi:hypothetical protein
MDKQSESDLPPLDPEFEIQAWCAPCGELKPARGGLCTGCYQSVFYREKSGLGGWRCYGCIPNYRVDRITIIDTRNPVGEMADAD